MMSHKEETITTSFTKQDRHDCQNVRSPNRSPTRSIQENYVNSEETHLLSNSDTGKKSVENRKEDTYGLFFLGLVLFTLIYNFAVNSLIITQYTYSFIAEEKFPEEYLNFSSGGACNENKSSNLYLDQQEIQKSASRYLLYSTMSYGVPAIIANIVFAALSDKYGRKLFICVIGTGNCMHTVLLTLGIYLKWNIYFLLPVIFLGGMTGGWIASHSVGFPAVADVTKNGKSRVLAIVLCEIALGMASLVGTASSGYLIDNMGYHKSMIVSSSIACVGFLSSIMVPETLKKQDTRAHSAIHTLKNTVIFYTRNSLHDGKRWKFWTCLGILLFVFLGNFGKNNVETLYQLNFPFCWSAITVGWYNTLRDGVPPVICMTLIKPFQKCMEDYFIAMLGILSALAGYILEGFAYNELMMILVAVASFMQALPIPIIRGVMSHMTSPDKQGSMFAGVAAIETVCSVAGGVAASAVYAATVDWLRGFVFFLFGGLTCVSFVLVVILLITSVREISTHSTNN